MELFDTIWIMSLEQEHLHTQPCFWKVALLLEPRMTGSKKTPWNPFTLYNWRQFAEPTSPALSSPDTSLSSQKAQTKPMPSLPCANETLQNPEKQRS